MRTMICCGLLIALATGCAGGPGLQGVPPFESELVQAERAITYQSVPASRRLQRAEWRATLDRVVGKIGPQAKQTCRAVGAMNCHMVGREISIVNDSTINAFVDKDNRISVHSGLLTHASGDDEIAAVLAHEYGHIFADHIAKQDTNATGGLLAGTALALLGGYYGVDANTTTAGAMELYEAGALAFSPEYELEADYYAALILERAGIDHSHGQNLLIRLARSAEDGSNTSGWGGRARLMATTHPADGFRIARWIGITDSLKESKRLSPNGIDEELRLAALNGLLAGDSNGMIHVGYISRWINPKTGRSGTMTLTGIQEVPKCGVTCAVYRQEDHQQGNSGSRIGYACWIPNLSAHYHSKKPWGFFGGVKSCDLLIPNR